MKVDSRIAHFLKQLFNNKQCLFSITKKLNFSSKYVHKNDSFHFQSEFIVIYDLLIIDCLLLYLFYIIIKTKLPTDTHVLRKTSRSEYLQI